MRVRIVGLGSGLGDFAEPFEVVSCFFTNFHGQ